MMQPNLSKPSLLLAAVLLVTTLGGCVVAPYGPGYRPVAAYPQGAPVYVNAPPPPPQVEVIGPPPAAGLFWIGGVWLWEGQRHVWHPGHWEANRPGYQWQAHHWERDGQGWRLGGGRWIPR